MFVLSKRMIKTAFGILSNIKNMSKQNIPSTVTNVYLEGLLLHISSGRMCQIAKHEWKDEVIPW